MPDPFREQRYSAQEVRRILRRAAELAEDDPETPAAERALTREELTHAAGDLGLPESAVARAAAQGEGEPAAAPSEAPRSAFLGARTRIVLTEEIEGEPSEADREDLVELIREVTGETGAVETTSKTLTWRVDPVYRGQGRAISVRLRSRDGRTRVVMEERLGRQATGLFVGLGVGGGIGPMGAYIAAIAKLGVVGLMFPLVWIPLMLLLARTIFIGLEARRRRTLANVMRGIRRNAAGWSKRAAPSRISVPRKAEADGAEEAEAEAEAEADEARAAASKHRRA
jgi:hypothetical protein